MHKKLDGVVYFMKMSWKASPNLDRITLFISLISLFVSIIVLLIKLK